MGLVEDIMQMQKTGRSDAEIISYLQQKGVTPRELQNALSQVQVKRAVEGEHAASAEDEEKVGFEGMQPSIMEAQNESPYPVPESPPIPEEDTQPVDEYYAPEQAEEYPPLPEEEIPYEEEYAPPGVVDTEIITEIAEQVVADKTQIFRRQVEDYSEFKTLFKTQVEHLESRLQRIEQIIDKLQLTILERIGTYLTGIEDVKKEMEMMQDSFSKVLRPEQAHFEKLRVMAHAKPRKAKSKKK
jgi:hypothetical protein